MTIKVKQPICGITLKRTLILACIIFSASFILPHISLVGGYPNSSNQTPTLTIYAYDSLLNWGLDPTDVNSKVFDAFESQKGCNIELEYFTDVGAILARAITEKNAPVADLIIGIDNVLIHEAKAQDLFIPYEPITSANLSISAINGLDPEFHVTPYDFGFIALIYHKDLVNPTTVPNINNLELSDLTDPTVAQMLLAEDPTLSSTGLGFLMWTIGVYEKVLDKDWELWWNATRDYIQVESSWGDAFDLFYNPAVNRPIMVSYATDPAYNYLFYQDTSVGATVSHENDSNLAWLQIEGIGIVKGTNNLALAQSFIDWFTGKTVQELFPENNWMYPANTYAELPASYDYAIDPTTVTPLNDLFTPEEINSSLADWQDTWQRVMILGYTTPETTTTTSPSTYPAGFLIIGPLIIIIILKKKNNRVE
ncbi:MAG: thiamine ABC transporter substrate-binding protein [Candidatus Heimdallarchaeota archaeon]|nr:MAG: thiamine ABC transporter substrate-binding protein [Candidatus Heimdallarchaeota archaeon]